jgi:hypothetical protein
MMGAVSEDEMIEIWKRHHRNGGDVISFGQEVAALTAKRAAKEQIRGIPPPVGCEVVCAKRERAT